MSHIIPPLYQLVASVRSRMNHNEKFSQTLNAIADDQQNHVFDVIDSCLIVGPGAGVTEIEFIRRLTTKLQSVTAVEPDTPSAEEFAKNMQCHLPNVRTTIEEKTIQTFIDHCKERFDAVLFFNMLWYLSKEERKFLFVKLHDSVLNKNGAVIINTLGHEDFPGNLKSIMSLLAPEVDFPTLDEFLEELRESGFRLDRQHDFAFSMDFSEVDDNLALWLSQISKKSISADQAEMVIKNIWPNGKTDKNVASLLIFRK